MIGIHLGGSKFIIYALEMDYMIRVSQIIPKTINALIPRLLYHICNRIIGKFASKIKQADIVCVKLGLQTKSIWAIAGRPIINQIDG